MPDERNWVEVVGSGTCAECGLRVGTVPRRDLSASLLSEAADWDATLVHAHAAIHVRSRPAPDTWSPLEYGCHVRDVLGMFAERVARALAEDEPEFEWWDHESAVSAERYNEQDPDLVAVELLTCAGKLARLLDTMAPGGWSRAGTRRGTERFTVEGLARFALHEEVHHHHDAKRILGGDR